MQLLRKLYGIIMYLILINLGCNRHFDISYTQYEIADFNDSEIVGEKTKTGKVIYHLQNNIFFATKLDKGKIKFEIKNESINKVICFGSNWQMFSLENHLTFGSAPDIDLEEGMNVDIILPKECLKFSFNIPDSIRFISMGSYFLTSLPSNINLDSLILNKKPNLWIPFNKYPEKNIDYLSIENIDVKVLKPETPLVISSY